MFIAGNFTHTAATGTFDHKNGTVVFDFGANRAIDVNRTETFNNLTLNKPGPTFDVLSIGSGDTLIVRGTLALTDGRLNTGTVEARGILAQGSQGGVSIASAFNGGTATLLVTGDVARTITMPAGAGLPEVTLNAVNVVLDTSGAGTISAGRLTLQAGTIRMGHAMQFAICPNIGLGFASHPKAFETGR